MAGLIIFKSAQYLAATHSPPLPAFFRSNSLPRIVQCIPIIVFSFGCSTQVVPVFYELKTRSMKNMRRVLGLEAILALSVYLSVAIFGYIQFTNSVQENILLNYTGAKSDVWVNVGRIVLALSVCLGFPLAFWPCRNTLEQLVLYYKHNAIPAEQIIIAWWINVLETIAIVAIATMLAIFIPSLKSVFGVVGSTSGMLIGFILPAAMTLKIQRKGGDSLKKQSMLAHVFTVFSLVFGVVIGVMGTVATIIN